MAETNDSEFRTLSDEERRALIERARRELPELDRRLERARAGLRYIASGQWRRRRA